MDIISFANWITSAPSWLQSCPDWIQNLVFQLYQTFIYQNRWKFFVDGLKITFIVTLGALALGTVLGLIIAIIRTSYDSIKNKKPNFILRAANAFCQLYLTVIRGTPMMVQLLVMGFVIMVPKTDTATIVCGIITLGINSGAYVAEIVRSGLMSINVGQSEAGRSLGFNYIQTMVYIVIPQMFKTVLPTLCNEFIVLLKETAVAGYVGIADLTKAGDLIRGRTFSAFMPLIAVAIIYFVIVMIFTKLVGKLERRLRKSDR